MKKRGVLMAILTAGALMLSGCGSAPKTTETGKTNTVKPVILTVSFGTSYNDSREKTIGAVEKAIADANPDYEVRRAFTSQIIIDKLKKRDNLEIDNVKEALDKLVKDGIKTLVVQPTHVMHGFEYDDVVAEVKKYSDKFDKLAIGEPLLSSDEDFKKAADAIVNNTKEYEGDNTCVVLMGHGTEHKANAAYAKLQNVFTANGPDNYFIGTVEAEPTVEDMVKKAKDGKYSKVVLRPLMVVAGDHANNDMAGDEDDSWKSIFAKEGFVVECVLKGMGEIPAIQQLYVSHVKDAIATLK
ncbi:MAG: sirohydrochlorin cobaltochelatase [Clostridia bacterium]|nr:sirohydrochlorin cobaltochelatase [Clostridia bacterium]